MNIELTEAEKQLILKLLDEQHEADNQSARNRVDIDSDLVEGYKERASDIYRLIKKLEALWQIRERWG